MYEKPILVVDDQQELLIMIRKIFERAGFTQIMTAPSGKDALNLLSAKMPAMAVLDVMMPGMDGFELLKEIRKVSSMPVLMLTAKGEPDDRCTGLELGADDYLVKPFLPRELLLRVTAILKRAYPEGSRIVTLAASQVDLDKAEVRKGDEVFRLTAKEYAVFLKLAENAGRIVTIGSLCQTACGEIWQGYESTLMTHIRHLREKIEENPSSPVSLITIKGLGYKLVTGKEIP